LLNIDFKKIKNPRNLDFLHVFFVFLCKKESLPPNGVAAFIAKVTGETVCELADSFVAFFLLVFLLCFFFAFFLAFFSVSISPIFNRFSRFAMIFYRRF
jgi:hypothetical protein